MLIDVTRVKKYNAAWNHVISIDGTPVAITKSANRANEVVAYLMGQQADLNDGAFIKQLDKYKKSHGRIENEY
ncbi:MAG: hypothetical protein L0M00_14930 [Lactiplantibacillus plantarum]|uniref:hypothetical protein n=1 Tax=Lentilactobacillus parabuchneri TaxID=152331 RepID=UPI0026485E99|nr:hypothetical protein [Lentilactobacillus parabuchneri]MDN5992700.1 hypothetical protein [Lactiplantibacillus plantarum]MDN6484425.1 hypothetical protein [Lactiplantibacillus plantarum]MDN6765910.1 hypothetical protein [Lactiplantibacillus plantarum]MDN6788112.1 hypothetical protein [Lentilactobacillus parabuchneri]